MTSTNFLHSIQGLESLTTVPWRPNLDSKWTPRDLFRDVEAREHFRNSMFCWALFWWTWTGSNRRPLPCHGSALPTAPQAHLIQQLRKSDEEFCELPQYTIQPILALNLACYFLRLAAAAPSSRSSACALRARLCVGKRSRKSLNSAAASPRWPPRIRASAFP